MADTDPWEIPLIDDASVVNPIEVPLNAMANAVNTALTALNDSVIEAQGYFIGTNAERQALTAPKLRNGITWLATDTNVVWRRKSGAWVADTPWASARGFQYVNPAGGVTVTFPAGRFTVPPLVFAEPQGAGSVLVPLVNAITKDSFYLRVFTLGGVATTANVAWRAEQATPTAVGG